MNMESVVQLKDNPNIPELTSGDTVRVHTRVVEGDKERIQVFQGVVIKIRRRGIGSSFTVRRVTYGVGVERTFPYYSPRVEKVEIMRRGKKRRAKLYYLRGLSAKTSRLQERRMSQKEMEREQERLDKLEQEKLDQKQELESEMEEEIVELEQAEAEAPVEESGYEDEVDELPDAKEETPAAETEEAPVAKEEEAPAAVEEEAPAAEEEETPAAELEETQVVEQAPETEEEEKQE